MSNPLRVLVVEDSRDDALLAIRELRRGGYEPEWERVETDGAMKAALEARRWDVVIAGHSLPGFSGTAALELTREKGLDLPFILVSGAMGEDSAVAAMRAGAHDYILKDNLARLVPAVEREVREAEVRRERRRALYKLRESEEKFRRIAENAPDIILRANPVYGVEYINPAVEEITGYTPDEIIGNLGFLASKIHPDDQTEFIRALKGGTGKKERNATFVELRLTAKDGSVVWLDSRIIPIVDGEGRLIAVECVARDATDRKLAEEALRESARQWSATFNSMSDAMCLMAPDGKILRCNSAMEAHAGKPKDEITGRPCWEAVHGAAAPVEGCPRLLMLKTLKREKKLLRVNGQHLEITVDPLTDDAGNLTGAVHVISDITERVLMEETLLSVSRQWEDTFNAVEDMILIIDRDYRVVQANRTARGLLQGHEHVEGMRCYELFHGKSAPIANCRSCTVFETGVPMQFEIQEKHLDDRWFNVSAYPVKNGSGKVQYSVHIMTDITEKKRLEGERMEMRQRLAQSEKLSALGEMISGVAHELNNPLSAVLGFSQLMLLEKDRPQEEQLKDITKIMDNAERCQRIVKNLLVFARRHKPEKGDVDIVGVIEDVAALRGYQLRVEDIGIFRTYPEGEPSINIYADGHQLHQVLLNLVNNAEHSIKEAGPPGSIIITVEREKDDVLIIVEDTGKGVRAEDMPRIFDPFYTTKEPGVGTGLGLSVSYGIIREHGGAIWAESVYGHGATFYIRLPAGEKKTVKTGSTAEHGASEKRKEASKKSYAGRQILVIDDEHPILNIMERILKREGCVVDCADNGDDAVALLMEKSYDLIISDMKMPEVSGEAIYTFLKESRPDLADRVLFTTGDTVNEATRKFFEETGVPFLGKPFSVAVLLNAVEEVFARCEEES